MCQIHERLPPGGILVFVTGQREAEQLCMRLRRKYASSSSGSDAAAAAGAPQPDSDAGVAAFGSDEAEQYGEEDELLLEGEDDFEAEEALEEEEEGAAHMLGGEGFTPQQLAQAEARFTAEAAGARVHVLPLYAMLPRAQQDAVFRPPPAGARLIVVATNVAETSLTIPGLCFPPLPDRSTRCRPSEHPPHACNTGVRYVVDAGRAKEKVLDRGGAAARFTVNWISQASAEQRAGRAGRTGPGHCYRLYSSAHFNDSFPPHADPEVLRTPLEGVALAMKAMGIDRLLNFPFPTPPERGALAAAQACLQALGALDAAGELTEQGRAMAALPLPPRASRLILQVGKKKRALPHAVALAAVMSVDSPFVHLDGEREKSARQAARAAHARLQVPASDALSALAAYCAYTQAPDGEAFCRQQRLHARNLREAAALHRQLLRALAHSDLGIALQQSQQQLAAPSQTVTLALRRGIAAGWADRIARRVRSAPELPRERRAVRYQAHALDEEAVHLHPRSGLARAPPEFVAYSEVVRTAKRAYMAGVTEVEAAWLAEVAAPLVALAPAAEDTARYDTSADAVLAAHEAAFGRHAWPLPSVQRPHPDPGVCARCFAAALLEGAVLAPFAALRPALAAAPATAAAPQHQGQRRVGDLVAALQRRSVSSRAALLAAWRADPAYLVPELKGWLRKVRHGFIEK